jgi:hypothetical protein
MYMHTKVTPIATTRQQYTSKQQPFKKIQIGSNISEHVGVLLIYSTAAGTRILGDSRTREYSATERS